MRSDLEKVLAWANQKLATGQEPPWAWYQYMKLRETLEVIIASQHATTTEGSQESDQPSGRHLRLVDEDDWQGNAQHHPPVTPTQLPM